MEQCKRISTLIVLIGALAVSAGIAVTAYAQSSAMIYTDLTNYGIGTTGPTQKLEVVGTVKATSFVGDGAGLTGISANSGWSDGGSNVYTTSTTDNVGIGTTTPSSTVEIVKTAAGTAPLMVSTTATSDGNLLLIGSDGNVGIGTVTPVGALTIMNGNVGIGTFSPVEKLEVVGNINLPTSSAIAGQLKIASVTFMHGYSGVFMGDNAGNLASDSFLQNTGVGSSALTAVTSGGSNSAFGHRSLYTNTTGGNNTAVGHESLANFETGGNNTAVGVSALKGSFGSSGTDNTAVGYRAGTTGILGNAVTTGIQNTFLGSDAGPGTSVQLTNATAIGYNALVNTSNTLILGNALVNVGIGTSDVDRAKLAVIGGNVGIGTVTPVGALSVMNGNVGIGTWSPTQKLEVVGTVKATSFVGDGAGLTGISANSGWSDGGTNVYTTATTDNVGIGTTTPSTTLEIVRQGSAAPLMVSSSATNDGDYLIVASSGNIGVGTIGPRGKLIIANGNVGIGTPSPEYQLQINENEDTAIPPEIVLRKAFSQDWYAPNFIGQMSSGTLGSPGDVVDGWNIVNLIGEGWADSSYQPFGWISIGVDGTPGFLDAPGAIRLYTTPDGSNTPVLRLTVRNNGSVGIGTTQSTQGLSVMNGNVGIGTWSPGSRLNIIGGNIGIGTTTQYRRIAAPTNGMAIQGNVGIGTWAANSGKLIVMGGNVGIGATNPGTALEVSTNNVNDTTIFRNTNSSGYANTQYINDSGNTIYVGIGGSGVGDYPNQAYFYSNGAIPINFANSSVTRMAIGAAGQVGIGTTLNGSGLAVMNGNVGVGTWSPRAKLEVIGSVLATSFYGDGSNLTGISAGGWTDAGATIYTTTTTDNVGIGSTNPGKKLEIADDLSNDVLIRLRNWNSAGVAGMEMYDSTGGFQGVLGYFNASSAYGSKMAIVANTTDDIAFVTGDTGTAPGTEKMTIKAASGNVGIGTTTPVAGLAVMNGNVGVGTWSPTQALQVVGTVSATAFVGDGSGLTNVANSSGWSDGGTNVYTATTTDNVAIGTTTPASRLTVQGNIGIGTYAAYRTIPGPNNGMILEGNVGIGTWASNMGKLTIIGGNVGIGTVSPGAEFDVTGNIRVSNNGLVQAKGVGYLELGNDNGGGLLRVGGDGSNTTVLAPSNDLRLGTTRNSASDDDISFEGTRDTGTKTWMMIKGGSGSIGVGTTLPAAGLAVMNGNVGIGTWSSPPNRLHVIGNIGIGTTLPYRQIAAPNNGMTVEGNVGIGTWNPRARLEINNTVSYTSVYDNGNSGTALTINWTNGNVQKVTLTGDCTFTFTAPGGIAKVMLQLVQDGTGGRLVTWPGTVLWPGGTDPTLTTTASAVDFISCLYNGSNYFCTDSLDFR